MEFVSLLYLWVGLIFVLCVMDLYLLWDAIRIFGVGSCEGVILFDLAVVAFMGLV